MPAWGIADIRKKAIAFYKAAIFLHVIKRIAMMCLSSLAFSTVESRLNAVSDIFASTESSEIILRVAAKAIKFYIEFIQRSAGIGWNKLQSLLQESSEVLGILQTVHCAKEMICADKRGFYFFHKYSLYKCCSRVFLLFYTIFTDIKLAQKLEFVKLQKIDQIVFWNITRLRCALSGTYILYRVFYACEGVRLGTWWKVAVSIGKIVMTVLEIGITAKKICFIPHLIVIRGISLGIDSFDMVKKIGVL